MFVHGLPEQPLENIVLEDLTVRSEAGIVCNYVQGLSLTRVSVDAQNDPALICNNVQGLQMTDVKSKTHCSEEPIV